VVRGDEPTPEAVPETPASELPETPESEPEAVPETPPENEGASDESGEGGSASGDDMDPIKIYRCCVLHDQWDGCTEGFCESTFVSTVAPTFQEFETETTEIAEYPQDILKWESEDSESLPRGDGESGAPEQAEEPAEVESPTLVQIQDRSNRFRMKALHKKTHHSTKSFGYLRNGNAYYKNLWPKGEIPLVLSPELLSSFQSGDKSASTCVFSIAKAAVEWMKNTCLKITIYNDLDTTQSEATDTGGEQKPKAPSNAVKLFLSDQAGQATGMGADTVTLSVGGSRADDALTIARHELGHVIGMHHTFVRHDRDKYIVYDKAKCVVSLVQACADGKINKHSGDDDERCAKKNQENYEQLKDDNTLFKRSLAPFFDYGSVMMYELDNECLTAIPEKLTAFLAVAKKTKPLISGITEYDEASVNLMYGCAGAGSGRTPD
jgi:hypothetical protein